MTKEEISQGYPVVNGFPKYVKLFNLPLLRNDEMDCYYCYQGNWSLVAEYDKNRHLIISHSNNWQLNNIKGKYLQPITLTELQELNKCL